MWHHILALRCTHEILVGLPPMVITTHSVLPEPSGLIDREKLSFFRDFVPQHYALVLIASHSITGHSLWNFPRTQPSYYPSNCNRISPPPLTTPQPSLFPSMIKYQSHLIPPRAVPIKRYSSPFLGIFLINKEYHPIKPLKSYHTSQEDYSRLHHRSQKQTSF